MNRRATYLLGGAAVAGVIFFGLYRSGVIGKWAVPQTRIASRLAYTGATTLASAAEDWPKWRGPRGDLVSREPAPDALPADGLKPLWSADVGLGYSSPIAARGRVYLFSMNDGKESLTAFDTRATPAIDGDRIYTYGGQGDLTCRTLADGKEIWRLNVPKEVGATKPLGWGAASSPLVAGNFVYVQGGSGGAIAVAVDKSSGKVAWKSEAVGVAGYAHPILADVGGVSELIVFGGEAIHGMDPLTGRTLWQHPWRTDYDVNASTPIYRDGKLFVTSEYNHGGALLALAPARPPSVVWENQAILGKFQGAILDGDHLYANSPGTIVCVNWADGSTKWRADDPKLRLGQGGSIVRAGGDKLVTMSERGKLSLLRATPAGFTLLGQANAVDGKEVWATPLLYGGRLYAKGSQELICFEWAK
jgi:hypothetical protein